MAGSPALLLLLSLGLCCTGAQRQRDAVVVIFNRNMKHPQHGQRLELECRTSRTTWGASWVRLDKDGNLHFIVSSNSPYNTVVHENLRISLHYEVSWRGSSHWLVVKSFTAQDQGIYFCVTNVNQVLHFSSGQPAFFPAALTKPVATTQCSQVTKKDISWHSPDPAAEYNTPNATTQSSPVTKRNSSQHGLDAETSNENKPNSSCDVFLWVRVAGTCLLLLTVITIIIMHHQRPSSP
ncbi:T-cell surface glycoprotein CD8 alpha chain-like [Coturnix japonica]|uniref:T-cell surface glycoprotein CD8 alpha chain-like n=1 Tax=Coturnix japonica TaxID=93934 RepID=UPI0013A5EC35|nr:T-cell surface glycoprotein CD8 alpha chain-like [Coturnix japonica]